MSDSTLKEFWQQVAEKKSCEAKQKELTAQRDTLADRLKKLEKSKLTEQADVDRLEGHSLAAFFYQVIGKMDEKLDKERQEAYAARVKYDVALHDLSSVDADLEQIQNRLARLSDCERQYQAALSEKIKSIKASAHPAAQLVAESESRIAALKVQKRELLEAIKEEIRKFQKAVYCNLKVGGDFNIGKFSFEPSQFHLKLFDLFLRIVQFRILGEIHP